MCQLHFFGNFKVRPNQAGDSECLCVDAIGLIFTQGNIHAKFAFSYLFISDKKERRIFPVGVAYRSVNRGPSPETIKSETFSASQHAGVLSSALDTPNFQEALLSRRVLSPSFRTGMFPV